MSGYGYEPDKLIRERFRSYLMRRLIKSPPVTRVTMTANIAMM